MLAGRTFSSFFAARVNSANHIRNHGAPLFRSRGGAPPSPQPTYLLDFVVVVDDQHRGIHRLRIARLLDIFNQRIRNLVPSGADDTEDKVSVERLQRG